MRLLEEHAREVAGMPLEWKAYSFRVLETVPEAIEVIGSIPIGTYTRGPRKGSTKWGGKDVPSRRVVLIERRVHDEWVKAWEVRTGKCSRCWGEGRLLAGWSRVTGDRWADCHVCKGTGKRRGE